MKSRIYWSFSLCRSCFGFTSFFLGAKSVCESATMDVRYKNSWYDEEGEKNVAAKLINEDKYVLINQHSDSQGETAVYKEKKRFQIFFIIWKIWT